jgi:hypothetical protein
MTIEGSLKEFVILGMDAVDLKFRRTHGWPKIPISKLLKPVRSSTSLKAY